MDVKNKFDQEGYVIIPELFNPAEISELSDQVDRIYYIWSTRHKHEIIEQQLVNMHSLTHPEYFKNESAQRIEFFDMITNKKLVQLVTDLFGHQIYFHNSQLFFNPPQNSRLPYWHRDLQYSSIDEDIQKGNLKKMLSLHIRIPLLQERGIELIPKTHLRWDSDLERNVRLELNGHKNHESLPHSKLISLKPGDILIFHSQMIHRGNYQLNPSRKALDLCVGKRHELTYKFFDPSILPSQKELEKIHYPEWFQNALQH